MRYASFAFIIALLALAACANNSKNLLTTPDPSAWTSAAVPTADIPTKLAALPTATPVREPTLKEPEGKTIAPQTADQLELVATLSGHQSRVYGLNFSSDSAMLVSGDFDDTLLLWDVASQQQVQSFEQPGTWDAFFAPDDGHVASDHGAFWSLETGELVHALEGGRPRAAFSPNGALLASAGFNCPIELWDVDSWQVVRELEGHPDRVFGLAFSPDSFLLASGSGSGPTDVSEYTVKVWQVDPGIEVQTLAGHHGDIHAVAFSPDGNILASGSTDGSVRLWDLAQGTLLHRLGYGGGLYDVAFSASGEIVGGAGTARTVQLWDVESGRLLRSLRHADEVMALAFSPDGTLLASGGYDAQIYLWALPQ